MTIFNLVKIKNSKGIVKSVKLFLVLSIYAKTY